MNRNDQSFFTQRSESELCRLRTETLYDVEVELRKIGWGDPAVLARTDRVQS